MHLCCLKRVATGLFRVTKQWPRRELCIMAMQSRAAGLPDIEDSACLSNDASLSAWECHDEAVRRGELKYTDPQTELAHKQRGRCCGCGCRHCPFQHANLKDKSLAQQPSWLTPLSLLCGSADQTRSAPALKPNVDVLFWSGGKDSFLALRALVREHFCAPAAQPTQISPVSQQQTPNGMQPKVPRGIVLVTTYDASSRIVAHQEVGVKDIMRQAQHLRLPLVGVPLHPGLAYLDRVRLGVQLVAESADIERICFGDLHLAHVREWRDEQLPCLGKLHYPLWRQPYAELLRDLERSQVPCDISALSGLDAKSEIPHGIAAGVPFSREVFGLAHRAGWDAFGENGEFHTLAKVWKVPADIALGLCPSQTSSGT